MPRLGRRKESEHTCKYCGKAYMTSVASYICPDCRDEHKKAYARERRRLYRLNADKERQECRKQRGKKKKPMEELALMAKRATDAGMTYGQYQAFLLTGGEAI